VIRQCLLRGIAVCPYGADPYTQSEFSAVQDADPVEVTIHQKEKETAMSKEIPAADAAAKTPDQVRSELVEQTKNYADRFGTELASKWGPLGEGKPLLDCYAEFVAKLRTDHEAALASRDSTHAAAIAELNTKLVAAETKATEAETRLSSLSLGEKTPVSGGDGKKADVNALNGLTAGATAFANEFKLPGGKE
jgi:hypothetical protein